MTACLYVGMGGFIGSVLRYLFGLIPLKTTHGFPLLGSLTVDFNLSLTKSLKTLIISMLLSFFIVKFVKL